MTLEEACRLIDPATDMDAEKRAERRTKSESCPYQHQAQVV